MRYRLNRQGQDLGYFTLEELRNRRQSGELQGTEWVLPEGASEWQALDSLFGTSSSVQSTPPPLPRSVTRKGWQRPVVWVVGILVVVFLAGVVVFGVFAYQFAQRVRMVMENASPDRGVALASQPVNVGTNTPTEASLRKERRAFRVRQYLDGFKQDGPVGQPWHDDAILLIESWIAQNHGGDDRTNLPSPRELGRKLIAAGCRDPLVLTVTAVNCGRSEATRYLKMAEQGFPQSGYKAYPKLYAMTRLAAHLSGRTRRIKGLDAKGIELLAQAFQDGSVLPGDQAEMAGIFVNGWRKAFFDRNHQRVIDTVRDAGKPYAWLALTLEGEWHVDAAWRARGNGWANSVTEQGWKGFADHLAKAREALTKAWKLRPDLPLPACRMIAVAMGQSDVRDMRLWFDRATAAQFDCPSAWSAFRWGLRPRWLGSQEAVLALGVAGLNTGRFDTDVPRKYFDAVSDVESDLELRVGEHIYGRADIWPNLQKMYEGYIAAESGSTDASVWRGGYAVAAYLAGHYDVARKQLEANHWKLWPGNTKYWGQDLSVMDLEVAARTSPLGRKITEAESSRRSGQIPEALRLYSQLGAATNVDARTRKFVRIQTALLKFEQRLQTGQWVDFLPTDENDDNWMCSWGKAVHITTNLLEIQSGSYGHLLYLRANVGQDFEARGDFDVVSSPDKGFQAGLVMGMPDFDSRFRSSYWFAFRMEHNPGESDYVIFSKGWTWSRLYKTVTLKPDRNSFQFHFAKGKVTASVNGVQVFRDAAVKNAEFTGDSFLVGVTAFGENSESIIRYRNLQVRRISSSAASEGGR